MRAVIGIVVLACSTHFAQASALESCCMRAATSKGHTGQEAACYASVCEQYVTMRADGHCGLHGRGFNAYRAALASTCGIGR